MSVLKEFLEKQGGTYSSEPLIRTHTKDGLRTSQLAHGELHYKNCKFLFWFNEAGIDPLRVSLILEKPIPHAFTIFPRQYWGKVFSSIRPNWRFNFPQKIHRQYGFSGKIKVIREFRSNQNLLDFLDGRSVAIFKRRKDERVITLTPSHGFETTEELLSYCHILIEVSISLKQTEIKRDSHSLFS